MSDALAIARIGLQDDLARLELASQNLANASTVGYRRRVDTSSRFERVLAGGLDDPHPPTASIDPRQGALQKTGRSLDLAFEGEGFLEVDTPAGPRYTRRGDLSLDPAGWLQSASGHRLAGIGTALVADAAGLTISKDGEVLAGDRRVGHLRLVDVADPAAMVDEGGGLFRLPDGAGVIEARTTRVRQGHLESSNVQPLEEMTTLMETSRHFEIGRSVVMAYDSLLDAAINSLASS